MVTVIKKVSSQNGVIWMNLSGDVSEVVQRLADEGLTARNVVGISYSDDGTIKALACRRE